MKGEERITQRKNRVREKRESPLENRSNKLGKQKIEQNMENMARREGGGEGG